MYVDIRITSSKMMNHDELPPILLASGSAAPEGQFAASCATAPPG